MKNKFIGFFLGLVAGALIFGSVALAKNSETRTLSAVFRGIWIEIDRTPFTPKDVNDNVVEPFIVDGTTYLPIRAISEAFDKAVIWDTEVYPPAIRIFTISEPVTEEEVMEAFAEVYLTDAEDLKDYEVSSAVLDSTNTWIVGYSVLPMEVPDQGDSHWIAGNGEYGENGWIIGKSFYVYVVKTDGVVDLRVIGTGL